MSRTVLITGGNRGVGLELVKAYLTDGWKVIAAVRDPSTMPNLDAPEGDLIIVRLDAGEKEDARMAVLEIQNQGVTKLDVVIANAGINLFPARSLMETDGEDQMEMFKINVRGPLLLLQATLPLLYPNEGKFVVISLNLGTTGRTHGTGNSIYGQSKAAVNFFVRKAHFEIPNRVILGLNPGWVPTEMGNAGATLMGLDQAPTKFSDTIPGMMRNIEEATKESTSGTIVDWTGEILDW